MISFFVEGVPTPQGSKTAYVHKSTGRTIIIDGGSTKTQRAHKAWRKAVKEQAEGLLFNPLDEPLGIRIEFFFEHGADRYRTRHATTPDLDKLVRSVLDGLTEGKLVINDSRFCELHVVEEIRSATPLRPRE